MKKKLTAVALIICMIAIMLVGATMAYFTDKTDEVENTFTVGNVKIELTEENWEEPTTVAPGDEYEKDPVVSNVGANAAWIRVDVTLSDAAAFTRAAATHQITDLASIFQGHDEEKWTLAGVETNAEDDTLTYSYYYNEALEPEANTGALFTSVIIPSAFTNAEMENLGDDFTITVVAHAIQTSEANYTDAAGAFANYEE